MKRGLENTRWNRWMDGMIYGILVIASHKQTIHLEISICNARPQDTVVACRIVAIALEARGNRNSPPLSSLLSEVGVVFIPDPTNLILWCIYRECLYDILQKNDAKMKLDSEPSFERKGHPHRRVYIELLPFTT